ncbi:FAD-binding oxidoreductase [Saccharopolyspora taberi]
MAKLDGQRIPAANSSAPPTGALATSERSGISKGSDEPPVVRPGDSRYEDLNSGFNRRWVARPDEIWLPSTADEVLEAVQTAVDKGKRVTVCGGGHCFEDFVFNPDVELVINMTRMDRVYFDAGYGAFAVEAGGTLLNVYEELYHGWGVTIPAGACYSVGIGGHICGGGFGLLSRKHGLTVDHLYGVDVVVVNAEGRAERVIATREEDDPNRELYWAHTGAGGGNFGVVLRYLLRSPGADGTEPARALPAPPREVYAIELSWPWSGITREGFGGLVDFYGRWVVEHSDPGSAHASFCSWMSLNHKSNGKVTILAQMDATVPGAADLVAEYVSAANRAIGLGGDVVVDPKANAPIVHEHSRIQRLPWLRATRYIGTGSKDQTDPNTRGKQASAYLRKPFPQEHIDTIYEHLTDDSYSNTLAGLVIASLGAKISTVDPVATAVAHRDSILKVSYETYWYDPAEDEDNIAWVRNLYGAVYADTGGVPVPNDVTDGCYINYPNGDITDPRFNRSSVPWFELYYKSNYPRLQRVKSRWDPRNVFHHRQSVRPPH